MRKQLKTYSVYLLTVGIALCFGFHTVAAKPLVKDNTKGAYASQVKGLPHSDIEIVNQPVNATGHTVLQKKIPVLFYSAADCISQKPFLTYSFPGITASAIPGSTHLVLIYPFHFFW